MIISRDDYQKVILWTVAVIVVCVTIGLLLNPS